MCTSASGSNSPPLHLQSYLDGNAENIVENETKAGDPWRIDADEVDIEEEALGEGAFGKVFKGTFQGKTVAVKMLIHGRGMTRDEFIREAEIVHQFNHENIIASIGICEAVPFHVTEFLPGRDLLHYIQHMANEGKKPTQLEYVSIARQIASAMAYLETNNSVHRDLAARNILVGSSHDTIKVSDFGLARWVDPNLVEAFYKNEEGAYKWTAPEAILFKSAAFFSIEHSRFTSKSDVWSFAVVLWELYSMGAEPYAGRKWIAIYTELKRTKKRLSRPANCPKPIYDKMLECWSLNPKHRPTFAQLLAFLEKMEATPQRLLDFTDMNEQRREKNSERRTVRALTKLFAGR